MKKFLIILLLLVVVGGGVYVYFAYKNKSKEISISQEFKTDYYIGDELDVTGGQIKSVSYSGDETIVDVTDEMISGFSTDVVGMFEMTLTYRGKEIGIIYRVKNLEVLEIISISGLKDVYNYEESLSLDNVKMTYRTNKSIEEISVTENMISNFITSSIGEKVMYISYGYQRYQFDYEVKAIKRIISVNGLLSEYYKGVYQNISNATAECENYDGTISEIKIASSMVTGFDYSTIGSKTMVITITGVSYEWDYEVIKNDVAEIISVNNMTTNFEIGGKLSLSGVSITYRLESGDARTTYVSDSMVSGFNTSTAGTKTMTITFEGKTKNVTYKVYNITDVVANGLYYSQVNHSLGKYLYVYVDGTPSSTGNFNVILSDTAPERMINNDKLYRLGSRMNGTRTVEDGYISYITKGWSNIRFKITVINGQNSLILDFTSEPQNVSFVNRNMTRKN